MTMSGVSSACSGASIVAILCGLLSMLSVGLAEAQSCPCWTAEELAAIRPNFCRNDLDLSDATSLSCTTINGAPLGSLDCGWGFSQWGWVMAWNGTIGTGFTVEGPGCYMNDIVQGLLVLLCQNENCDGPITEEEALSCAEEIAAFGETAVDGICVDDGAPCDTDEDCVASCSIDGTACQEAADCPLFGFCNFETQCFEDADCEAGSCSVDQTPCYRNSDCSGFQFCQGSETCENITLPQSCVAQSCSTVDCFPQDCKLEWNVAKSDIVFTSQEFLLGVGMVADLTSDGDFAQANCLGPFSVSAADDPLDPNPGEARYFLGKTVAGVSCVDYGDSSQVPDPRELLDASCP